MIERYESETNLRMSVGRQDHSRTELSVGRDTSDDGVIILGLRRWDPMFDVTAFLSFDEALELAQMLTEITGEWTPSADAENCGKVGS